THVRIHSNIVGGTTCRGDISNFKGHVWYDTGVYKNDQWRNSDHDYVMELTDLNLIGL
ncbi:10707_t:CDS:2, partial [Funneliformis caledonium]